MRAAPSLRVLPFAVSILLACCQAPPPDAYVQSNDSAAKAAAQVAIGKNSVGEACTQQGTVGQSADVYCGTWNQPSARVRFGGSGSAADLARRATDSPWRNGLNGRFNCEPPVATTILGGQPAELMQCTWLVGGWSHVAMVALVNGRIWYADGVLPAAQVMERSIGILAGVTQADATPLASGADALLASRLAAHAFGSGEVGDFQRLIEAGTRANLEEDSGAAESAFRAALVVQRKAQGQDSPNTASTLMSLALQLSDEGRYAEAKVLFDAAAKLAPAAADRTTGAKLLHYEGLDAINQGQFEQALTLLTQAEAGYTQQIPPDALTARPRMVRAGGALGRTGQLRLGDLMPNQELLTSTTAQSALLGLIEARRGRGVALLNLNRPAEAADALRSSEEIARNNGLALPIVNARLDRTIGVASAALGLNDRAATDFSRSSTAFDRSLPGSKPLADSYLLQVKHLEGSSQPSTLLPLCQRAVQALSELKAGTSSELMGPCLADYAAVAEQRPADRQSLLAEMFLASQLAQGDITSQQIAQAAARLAENRRDPKVSQAIRDLQDAGSRLNTLYRQRDELIEAQRKGAQAGASTDDLDKQISQAQQAVANADSALQAASPNYGQLVQQVVPAKDVFAALRPNEALAAITLGAQNGWVFLLRNGAITASKIDLGTKAIAGLVSEIRASIESDSDTVPPFNVAAAQKLYQAIFGNLTTALGGSETLIVAPTGPLLSLPFEVLLTGPADPSALAGAPWLVRKFTMANVPAPANFVSLRKIATGSNASHPWFGFGDFRRVTLAQAQRSFPSAECADSARRLAGLPPLPFADKELDIARKLFGSGSAELRGAAFTADAVIKAPLKDYRILQFSTHALLPAELRCQNEPAIVTSAPANATNASGALLSMTEVEGLDLNADLIILSGCNTGGADGKTAGESLSGLARAFFYAGARSVLATHWSVNDQVGAYLIAETLRRLRDEPGRNIAEVLRETEIAMIDGAGNRLFAGAAHPFYWAPYVVIGDGGAGGSSQRTVASLQSAAHP